MAADRGNLSRKMAAILHADVTSSTALVHLDEALAHERINEAFSRFSQSIELYGGTVHELRGDALVAEFPRASDAVCAALAFQESHSQILQHLDDEIRPTIRIGVSLGEVIFADGQVTGAGVVLAQRVEQLAEPGGLCITAAIHEALPQHMPFDQYDLGEQEVKGFEDPVRVYRVALRSGDVIPAPEKTQKPKALNTLGISAAVATIVLIITGGLAYWYQPWTLKEEPASVERMSFPLPDKPSIAILPFSDLSDSDEHTYIADGLTENIIATLGKISGLFVIDRGTVARYSDGSIKAHQVSEELGVRYILKGSVQKSGDRLRVATTLVDTSTGHHVWSERYDRDITDLFSVQDEITGRIVVELQVNLTEGEQARLKYDSTTNFDAWANFMRGSDSFYRFTKEDNAGARELFERAVDLDPQYAIAWGWLAWTHWIDARFGYSESREVSFTRAEELAAKAVELDPELADALSLLGAIHLYKREYDEALDKGRMAIDLGPNNANINATVAITTYSVGDWGETIKLLKRAMRLSPYYPSWYLLYLGRAQTFQGDYKEAIATHEKGLARAESPYTKSGFHAALAFAHMEAGNEQRAREFMAQTLEVIPHYSASYVKKTNFFKDTNDLDRLIGALQKAGMPGTPPLKLPDKPSIVVLPFTNMSDDPQQEYFVDGMTEDLITDLSKLSGLFVIARNSVFTYKDKPVKVNQVAKELGVRYVLEGSVRRVDNRVRINAQLIDATTEGHLWGERYDRLLDDVFTVQDEIRGKIINALAVKLTPTDHERGEKYEPVAGAYDAFLQGWDHLQRHTPEEFSKAVPYLEKATQIDPDYGRAYAALAWLYFQADQRWWHKALGLNKGEVVRRSDRYIQEAMKRPTVLAYRVNANRLWQLDDKFDEAVLQAQKAVELDPGDPDSHAGLARALIHAGRADEAMDSIRAAMRLDPHYPAYYLFILGLAYFGGGDLEKAVEYFERSFERNPEYTFPALPLAAAYTYLGDKDKAQAALNRFERVYPWDTVDGVSYYWPFKKPADSERFLNGLRKAGYPEYRTVAPPALDNPNEEKVP